MPPVTDTLTSDTLGDTHAVTTNLDGRDWTWRCACGRGQEGRTGSRGLNDSVTTHWVEWEQRAGT